MGKRTVAGTRDSIGRRLRAFLLAWVLLIVSWSLAFMI